MEKESFSTQNTPLALALLSAGCSQPEITQCYSDEMLKKHGAQGFADARDRVIPDLIRRGLFGVITYTFRAIEGLQELIGAYNEQMGEMEAGKTVTLPNITPEEAMRLSATLQHNKKAILEILKHSPPLVRIARGEGWVAASTNAGPELLKHLNIKL